jgi:hypothetical protein
MTSLWTKILVGAAALLVLIGAGLWYAAGAPMPGPGPGQGGVACTADAMQCPDGSWVGRSGPHCEFICPTASSTAGGTSTGSGSSGGGIAPYQSGIEGTVLAGPTCPVERNPPDPACADRPLATGVSVSHKGSTDVFATTQSNAQGVFKISLPPGQYTVTAGSGSMLPRCNPVDATVGPSGYAQVAVSCDTGIR